MTRCHLSAQNVFVAAMDQTEEESIEAIHTAETLAGAAIRQEQQFALEGRFNRLMQRRTFNLRKQGLALSFSSAPI